MEAYFAEVREALATQDGYRLAQTMTPVAPSDDPDRLHNFHRGCTAFDVQNTIRQAIIYDNEAHIPPSEGSGFVDVYVAYWKVLGVILAAEETTNGGEQADWVNVYNCWKELASIVNRHFDNAIFTAWSLPCLYVAGKYLRSYAILADEVAAKGNIKFNYGLSDDVVDGMAKHDYLEDASRKLTDFYKTCAGDRGPLDDESRKWGIYYIVNLQFKTYFKLDSINLSKSVLRSLQALRQDVPDLSLFPLSQFVTFKYYEGVIAFVDEDYKKAEECLNEAWNYCHKGATKNRELILIYLIPCRMITSNVLPTKALLSASPNLGSLFEPLVTAVKRGDLAGFDAALEAGENAFVKRRIYLTLERGRDICMRNVFRKVYLAGEPVPSPEDQTVSMRPSRIPIANLVAALNLVSRHNEVFDSEDVECFAANMIYKGFMKGYISHEHQIVVLSRTEAFPGTGI
ncbi:hypothetical protein K402DRAFT_445368 [Aulographum hederae CBS 113979]|uniref:PCI domain-containing protein n=1 Tax=Aulographum hederae CBS 113979 TaxID=1176131 RepID=A0A6G1H5P6_9PEZI|nr:hypothetical protein K402DRAFT_445368 [Aulographum hederae CBS 113979]